MGYYDYDGYHATEEGHGWGTINDNNSSNSEEYKNAYEKGFNDALKCIKLLSENMNTNNAEMLKEVLSFTNQKK